MIERTIHPFVAYLQALASEDNRGALAALRRGSGQPPGTAPEMFRYVEPFLPQRRSMLQETTYYLMASLFAIHPKSTESGNFGTHMAQTGSTGGEEALERRFSALLSAHPDDLPGYLRQAVSFLKSKEVPINWSQLFWDVQHWGDENHRVQKEWANAFWGRSMPEEASPIP